MKNIQVGDIVRVKDYPHRYVVENIDRTSISDMEYASLRSIITADVSGSVSTDDLELVEGIERVQRGDLVKTSHGWKGKVIEVGFNSFLISESDAYNEALNWCTFQEAKDWKIVGKEEKCKHEYGVSTRIFMDSAEDEVIEQFCRECGDVTRTTKRAEEEEPKGKVFKEFDKDKHVITLDPELLVRAEQEGGVIISTDSGLYKLEKIST